MPPPQRIRAVLFDAAGTFIRPSEAVGATYVRLAREFGVVATSESVETAFRAALRHRPPMAFPDCAPERRRAFERDWWRELVAATFRAAGTGAEFVDFDGYFDLLFAHFADPAAWQLLPGTREALRALREMGLRTGVVSNFDHRLDAILEGLDLTRLLDVVMLPYEAGAAKPDPRIFYAALERLRLAPAQAVYVGDDAVHDIEGARAAGLQAIDVATVRPLTRIVAALEKRA